VSEPEVEKWRSAVEGGALGEAVELKIKRRRDPAILA